MSRMNIEAICGHPTRREIAEPQTNVEQGRLLKQRFWWCPRCGEKWWTKKKLGDVSSITLSVELL